MHDTSIGPVRKNELDGAPRSPEPIDVAVVALWRQRAGGKEVLVTRRPARGPLPGSWELPGGKLEPGEPAEQAAKRELLEETGLVVIELRPLVETQHRYGDLTVRLHAFIGRAFEGAVVEHRGVDDHRWVAVCELTSVEMPSANEPITAAIVRALVR